MKTKRPSGRLGLNQQGFASLVIAMVLVLLLSLMTVGFAQLMRREQRSALDKHLSSQAYYAAESGINDAAKALNEGYSDPKSTCDPLPVPLPSTPPDPTKYLSNSNVGPGISYSCLLVDPAPPFLKYDPIDFDQSKAITISGADPANPALPVAISQLVISWQSSVGGNTTFRGVGHDFTPLSSWGASPSVLRIGLTPLYRANITRDNLINSTYTAFLYPNAGSSAATSLASYPAHNYASNVGLSGGAILDGDCHTGSQPQYCNTKITGLDQVNYLLDLRSLAYGKSKVTIAAYGVSGTQLRIKNAQTVVDSTGKAQDVLRRVQVRIPTRNTYDHTDYGLEVMNGICKQLKLYPAAIAPNTNNPLCN